MKVETKIKIKENLFTQEQNQAFLNRIARKDYKTAPESININIGTIGHVDHGKTTTTAGLTKVSATLYGGTAKDYSQIDNTPEEKARGITIKQSTVEFLGERFFIVDTDNEGNKVLTTINNYSEEKYGLFYGTIKTKTYTIEHICGRNADFNSQLKEGDIVCLKIRYSHVDCPGHADYVKNMITGTANMDASILVVSGADGAQTQTTEHILLAKQIGIETIIVYLNKADLVDDPDMLEMAKDEIAETLENKGYEKDQFVMTTGSSLLAFSNDPAVQKIGTEGIEKLLSIISNFIDVPARNIDEPFYMPIESVHSISGRGTVVTGVPTAGELKLQDKVFIYGTVDASGASVVLESTVTGLERFRSGVDKIKAGENVGILLRGITKEQVSRGFVLSQVKLSSYKEMQAKVFLISEKDGGRSTPVVAGYIPQMYIDTADVSCILEEFLAVNDVPGEVEAQPGSQIDVMIKIGKPMTLRVNQNFTLREGGRTIGSGVILKLL